MRLSALFPALFFPVLVGLYAACSSGEVVQAKDAGSLDVVTEDVRQDANEIPCGPRRILETICQQCHTRPPLNGAPFPLVNRSDILTLREGRPIREIMIEQIEFEKMPLAPVTMTSQQRAILVKWLRDGAPAVEAQACLPTEDGGSDSGVDSGFDAGQEEDDAGTDASDE